MNKKVLNAYEVLELDFNASINDIKLAYKQKAKLYHPDTYKDKNDKEQAEKEFKKIKEAYDDLIDFQNEMIHEKDFSDIINDNFNIEVENENKEQQQKTKESKKFANLQKKAVDLIQDEIDRRQIHILKVFDAIEQDKLILTWDYHEYSQEEIYDWLVKESLYRRYIKETNEYQGYIKNKKFYEHLDKYATLTINPNLYKSKRFDEKVKYIIDELCFNCCGVGCNECNYFGYIRKEQQINIKIPINEKSAKFYEIKNGGNHSNLVNGKLIITVKINKHLKSPYKLTMKNDNYQGVVPILDGFNSIKVFFMKIFDWIKDHKHLTVLYALIVILLIVIICLATLL